MLANLFLFFVLLAAPAQAENLIKVCVELPSGSLVLKTATIGASMCPTLSTPHEVIGVWVFWEQSTSQFAEEYSGHELFSCFDDSDGQTTIQQRDTSGAGKGAKRKTYAPNAAPPTQLVDIPNSVAATASAGQVQWIVTDGGSGGSYNGKLSTCRTLVSYPPS